MPWNPWPHVHGIDGHMRVEYSINGKIWNRAPIMKRSTPSEKLGMEEGQAAVKIKFAPTEE